MKPQYGLLAMLIALSLSAQAEQPSGSLLGPADNATQISNPEESPATTEQINRVEPAQEQPIEQAGFSKGSVVRSALTSAVEGREPTDSLQAVSTEQQQLFFFTELRDMSGQTAKHRWEHNGKVMAEVEFTVKGPRWRVWSSKSFVPNWTGDWKVSVINGAGDVISEKNFTYETASATQPDEPAAPVTPAGINAQ